MSGNFKKDDLRVIKTQKAFLSSIKTLLERRKFRQITVNDLCEEALTSRAAFYAHYKDKYDLLNIWFYHIINDLGRTNIESILNYIIYDNSKLMQNILFDADDETIEIVVNGLFFALLDLHQPSTDHIKNNPEYLVLSNFCTGGLFEMLKLQAEQQNSADLAATQTYLFDLLKTILEYHIDYKKKL